MLYLAEVEKQKGGLLGSSSKTGLKLLACQRKDQSWTTVPEELIGAEEASKLSDGALVLVEMNSNHQVQRIQEAGHPLVNILQNFSRQLEKFKHKEQEIDQWKESLTFQAQEFNRREMEMETRLEELQHLEEQKQQFDTQREEIQNLQAEIDLNREELERNREELEGAWEHLRGEQRLIEEHKAGIKSQPVLDRDKSHLLADLLERLSSANTPPEAVGEYLQQAFEVVDRQQAVLNPHLEQLEEKQNEINLSQTEVDRLSEQLNKQQDEWEQAKSDLDSKRSQLQIQTAVLESKQEKVQLLKEQLQRSQELGQQLEPLVVVNRNQVSSGNVDIQALENISLEELQRKVKELENKLKIDSSFVEEQEEELNYKQEAIAELEQKIAQATDEERSGLETELQDEKDSHQMLNETLVGQRRSLLERQSQIEGHQAILNRRQGNTNGSMPAVDNIIDLRPILTQLEAQKQKDSEELKNLEAEIEQILSDIKEVESVVDSLTQEQESKRQELQTIEENLLSLRTTTAESSGRFNMNQEVLLPIQDYLNNLREKLQGISDTLGQGQETGDVQQQAIAEMREIIDSLLVEPELVAS